MDQKKKFIEVRVRILVSFHVVNERNQKLNTQVEWVKPFQTM